MKGLHLLFVVKLASVAVAVHALALVGPAMIFRFAILPLLTMDAAWFVLGVVGIVIDLMVLLPCSVLATGGVSQLLNLRYAGEHEFDLRDREVQKWLTHMAIYLPTASVLDFLHAYPLKSLHARLFGARIGKSALLAGLILDPCLTEIGEQTHVGGFVVIFGHSAEADRGRIIFAPVRIGACCGLGARAQVMPGAVMEDGSRLGPQSLLIQNGRCVAGATYIGVPARKILDAHVPARTIEQRMEVVSCR